MKVIVKHTHTHARRADVRMCVAEGTGVLPDRFLKVTSIAHKTWSFAHISILWVQQKNPFMFPKRTCSRHQNRMWLTCESLFMGIFIRTCVGRVMRRKLKCIQRIWHNKYIHYVLLAFSSAPHRNRLLHVYVHGAVVFPRLVVVGGEGALRVGHEGNLLSVYIPVTTVKPITTWLTDCDWLTHILRVVRAVHSQWSHRNKTVLWHVYWHLELHFVWYFGFLQVLEILESFWIWEKIISRPCFWKLT